MTTARRLALAAAAALALAGCTSTPQASREDDNAAKQFVSHPGTAAIYVYRLDTTADDFMGSYSVLWINDRLIGSTLPRGYFRVDVQPGKQILRGDGPDLGRLTLDTASGDVYFVAMRVQGGTSHFWRVDAPTAKREIERCCALLENWAPGQRPLIR